jgi:hypothetical protein
MKLSKFKEQTSEIEGVWVDVGEGVQLKLARADNSSYQKEVSKILLASSSELRILQDSNPRRMEIIREARIKAISRTILLDWRNLQDENGKELKYSPELAEKILVEYKELLELVDAFSTNREMYKAKLDEDSRKN